MGYFQDALNTTVYGGNFIDVTLQGVQPDVVNQAIDKLGKLVTTSAPHEHAIEKLGKLVVANALLDQGDGTGLPRCHRNTRERVRKEVDTWSFDMNAKPILWLNGPVGIGKSTVLRTLSEKWFRTDSRPGACFIFSHTTHCDEEQRGFVPTLAYQLAQSIPSFHHPIVGTINKDPVLLERALGTQFEHLIVLPLMAASSTCPNLQVVIVIDGLDESFFDPGGRSENREEHAILRAIAHAYKKEPRFPVRFLIASRRDMRIVQCFKDEDLHEIIHEIRLDEHSPTADIQAFLEDELRKIQESHDCDIEASWPPEDMIDALVHKSSGQFLYSSTVVQFVGKLESDPRSQLNLICRAKNPQVTPDQPFLIIDHLYIRILSCIKETSRESVLSILGPLCFKWGRLTGSYGRIFNDAASAQSPGFLEKLFFIGEGQLRGHLIDLGSVLDIPRREGYLTSPIRPFHASFFEFLTDGNRSGELCICKKQAHLIRQVTLMKHIFIFLSMPQTSSPYDEWAVVRLFTRGIQRMYLEDGTCDQEVFVPDQELKSGLEALMSSNDRECLEYLQGIKVEHKGGTSWRCSFKKFLTPVEESSMCRYIKDCAVYDTSASWVPRTWQRLKWGSRAIFLESAVPQRTP